MKNLLFALSALAVLFTGCSKDDDDYNNTNSELAGKWEATSNYELKNGTWQPASIFYDEGLICEFTNNGKVIMYDYGVKDSEGSYSYNPTSKELVMFNLVCEISLLNESTLQIIGLGFDDDRMTDKVVFRRIN